MGVRDVGLFFGRESGFFPREKKVPLIYRLFSVKITSETRVLAVPAGV